MTRSQAGRRGGAEPKHGIGSGELGVSQVSAVKLVQDAGETSAFGARPMHIRRI